MVNYNLTTYLLLLLSVVTTVLMASFVDSYSQFNISEVLSLRIFNTEEASQEEVKEGQVFGAAETQQMAPEGWVGYPVVSINRTGDSGFAPGVN